MDRRRRTREDRVYLVGYHDRLDRRYMPGRASPALRDAYRRGWDDAHRAVRSLLEAFEEVINAQCCVRP